jgi:hypothetical protein
METLNSINIDPQEPIGGAPTPPGSKLGIIGIVLGILGIIVYCLPLSVAFIAGAMNKTDSLGASGFLALSFASYCGVFIGLIGAVVGGISLARGESRTFSIISIVIAVLPLCACSVLTVISAAM